MAKTGLISDLLLDFVRSSRRARQAFDAGDPMAAFMLVAGSHAKLASALERALDLHDEDLGMAAAVLWSELLDLDRDSRTAYLKPSRHRGRGGRPAPSADQILQTHAAVTMERLMSRGRAKGDSAKLVAKALEDGGHKFVRRNRSPSRSVEHWHFECTGGASSDEIKRKLFVRLRGRSEQRHRDDGELLRHLTELAERLNKQSTETGPDDSVGSHSN